MTASVAAIAAPIRRARLADQVVEYIRDLIVHAEIEQGSRIVEGTLCQRLGVSRTPLREALRTLEGEGLIEFVPARGAVVRRLTREAARDMLEVITGLEAYAGRLACERASDADIAFVRSLHADLEHHYQAGDRQRYFKINVAIHAAIVSLAKNAELQSVHKQFQARSRRIRYSGLHSDKKWRAAVDDHRAMIDALARRDADALAAVLRRHLRLVWGRVQNDF